MTVCWSATGDSFGYEGVAFTTAGDVWALDGSTLRRLSFPAMSDSATIETITIGSLTVIESVQAGVACVDTDPIVCGPDADGDAVVVNAGTDTVIRNFGVPAVTGDQPIWATYSPSSDKLYVASFGVGLDSIVYRMDPDGSNLETVWSSSTEDIGSYLLVASDGAIWWTTATNVYRADGLTEVSLADPDNNELTHDPENPTRTLAYPFFVGDARFTYAAGSITADTPTCDDPGLPEAAAISHDGTKGILATEDTVLYWILDSGRWHVGYIGW